MRAYSMDLRERVLRDSDAGMLADAVAERYHVSGSWVRWLKQLGLRVKKTVRPTSAHTKLPACDAPPRPWAPR